VGRTKPSASCEGVAWEHAADDRVALNESTESHRLGHHHDPGHAGRQPTESLPDDAWGEPGLLIELATERF
jgi:hypothetical protein